jgi:3D (Asp-Asp-Asp) domain-containing protein
MRWGRGTGPVFKFLLVLIVLFLIICFFLFQVVAKTSADDRINLRLATRTAPIVRRAVKTIYCEVTAYNPTRAECDAAPLITASGQRVRVGGIAADLRVLPFGSIVVIPNYNNGNPCVVTDTGSAIRGTDIDVFMWSTDAAIHWGRRKNVPVRVLFVPEGTT